MSPSLRFSPEATRWQQKLTQRVVSRRWRMQQDPYAKRGLPRLFQMLYVPDVVVMTKVGP